MVSIGSPLVVSYMTFIMSNIVSLSTCSICCGFIVDLLYNNAKQIETSEIEL